MTDREFWQIVWAALKSIETAIAKKWGFGEYKCAIMPNDNRPALIVGAAKDNATEPP